MRFKGKVAVWFWGVIILTNAMFLYDLIFFRDSLAALLVGIVGCNLIFLPLVIRNYVEITEESVKLVFGIFKDSIRISDIREVYQTHNVIASSAASLDRIVIKGTRNEIMCAVKDKKGFYEELQKRNPQIIFRSKKKT